MRRSLAPSQRGQLANDINKGGTSKTTTNANAVVKEDVMISRLPLFGFLEIPEALNKQFKIPSGCIITERWIGIISFSVVSMNVLCTFFCSQNYCS